MFGDIVKFGVRAGAVVAVMGVIVGLIAAVPIPAIDYTAFNTAIGRGFAFMNHWIPGFSGLWNIFIMLFGAWVIVQTARFAIYTSSIVLKIFK